MPSSHDVERGKERDLEESPGRFSRLGRAESGARLNGLLASIHATLAIRIATRPPRPPFFDARQSRKNREEGGGREKKSDDSSGEVRGLKRAVFCFLGAYNDKLLGGKSQRRRFLY
jgi:hypothetical protein